MMTENDPNPEETMPEDNDALEQIPADDDASETENELEKLDNPPFDEDDFDVESAIAAISTLSDLTREEERDEEVEEDDDNLIEEELSDIDGYEEFEAEDQVYEDPDYDERDYMPVVFDTEDDFIDDEESEILEARFEETPPRDSTIPQPPPSVLNRGTLPSVTPAILLIGVGGLLTLLLTTSDDPIPASLLLALAIAGVGVILLGQWLSSGRWSVGNFLFGSFLLLTGATGATLIQTDILTLQQGAPLILTALGLAFVLTDIFTATTNRVWFIGLVLGLAGIVGVMLTGDLLDESLTGIVQIIAPIVLGLLVLFLIVPIFRRNTQQPASEGSDE